MMRHTQINVRLLADSQSIVTECSDAADHPSGAVALALYVVMFMGLG
jgi:hypothetical protein